jgi:hypothetical protein
MGFKICWECEKVVEDNTNIPSDSPIWFCDDCIKEDFIRLIAEKTN